MIVNETLTVKKYKARVRYAAPNSAKTMLHQYKQCFLGYSLENEKFEIPKLKAMIHWINPRFKRCFVLIGDSIHRLTIQINKDLEESKAIEEAYQIRDAVIRETSPLFLGEEHSCCFEYILCSQIQKLPDYEDYHNRLVKLYRMDQKFAESVDGFAENFIMRKMERSTQCLLARKQASSAYILEEAAIFACLVKKEIMVAIYPGTLAVFAEISNGEHPNAPEELKQMVNIGLGFR